MTLLDHHRQKLIEASITPEMIELAGVYSIDKETELPAGFGWYGEAALPAIVFQWRSPVGDPDAVVLQLKPDVPVVIDDDERKYLLAKGAPSVLNAIRPDGGIVLLVEGTKQHLAAASYAPDDHAVFGLMGCDQWMDDGSPITDLAVVEDKEVVVCLDADMSSNLQVWTAASRLGDALRAEGATDVKYIRLPAGLKAGLDDVLARRAPERRTAYLARLIDEATGKLPAKPRGRAAKSRKLVPESDDRSRIVVAGDQYKVINDITDALVMKWSGTRLFGHGGVIAARKGHILEPVDKGAFLDLIQTTARTVIETEEGDEYAWPHPNCVAAALTRIDRYAPLHRISRTPFIRPDGTVCQKSGYDEVTETFLINDFSIEVPEEPTAEQVQAARDLLLDDWLVDMPFTCAADRANVLALCVTPAIRGLVDLVPLAVIDGLQMGVGKNLLSDCVSILATGEVTDPLPYSNDNEEMRKLITSTFRRGLDFVSFDEAHLLEGDALARTLTALFYSDRVLGVSRLATFPNRVTWLALGNQVQVRGDVARRIYPIALRPTAPNPELRNENEFRHPNLRLWTKAHRPELVTAVLTLIRAWYVAGEPASARGGSFGSFEAWGRMAGGIVELVGEMDFLGNVARWRSDSDFEMGYWAAHLRWLHDTFGEEWFTCSQVRRAVVAGGEDAEPPPGMEDTTPKDYSRILGQRYSRQKDKTIDGYRLVKSAEVAHNNVNKWSVRNNSPDSGGQGGNGGDSSTFTHKEKTQVDAHDTRAHAYRGRADGYTPVTPVPGPAGSLLPFDLETAGTDGMWSTAPGFVRLVGYRSGDAIVATTDPRPVLEAAAAGATLVGHNIWNFDLPVLAQHHRLDLTTVSAIDTKLLAVLADPPEARMSTGEVERRYALDALGNELLGRGKTGDLKALAREFGGFGEIPTDDPRYLEYVKGDVEVAAALAERFGPLDDYATREHEVARLAAVMSMNGFRVDTDLLAERVAAGEATRTEMLERLSVHGLPNTKKDGKPCKAPHATEEGKRAIVAAFADLGVRVPRTPKDHPAFDQKAMDRVIAKYPHARDLAETIKSLNGIRTVNETVAANLHGDRVHPTIDFRQASGRWSITKPGLTVMGKRGGRHREREIFLAEEGHVMISADLSQVDARAVAVHSQDPAYLSLFEPGRDAHAEIARRIWGDPSRREEGKALGHGFNYGEGPSRIAREAGVTEEFARDFHRAMCEQFPLVVEWQTRMRDLADAGELLENGFGRRLRVTTGRSWTQAPALVGQSCARDLMMEGLLRLDRSAWPYLRAVVHDELVLSVPIDIVEDVEREVIRALSFEWAPPGKERTVQIVAGLVGRGLSWGAVYEKGS